MRRLPPLTALRPFEAAARTSSFAKAGDELCLTPSAIAHQIKTLEAFLGFQLFDRLHRGVALNRAGEAYYATVQVLLDQLESSTRQLQQSNLQAPLRITALHAFAEKWFMPRWAHFQQLHPHMDVEITANHFPMDVTKGDLDIWISHSEQPPENGQADLLLNDPMTPVCSPGLLQELAGVEPAEMLRRSQWVCDLFWRDDWQVWLQAAGIEMDNQSGSDQLGFNLYSMVIQAVTNGLGFAMGHLRLVEDELASGALVAPFDLQVPSGKQFYAVYSERALERDDVQLFRRWLLEQVDADGTESAD